MADISVPWTLSTTGTSVVFNNGTLFSSDDMYYLTEVTGMDGVPLRLPTDLVPLGDGGIVHSAWLGPRHAILEGLFLIQSTRDQTTIRTIRNQMEIDLREALDACISPAFGNLSWTPAGQSGIFVNVYRDETPVSFTHTDNYLTLAFSFGLYIPSSNF